MSSPKNLDSLTLRSDLGRKGEELAAAYLNQQGFQIVAANFTVPVGRNRNDAVINVEIDLVAYEGPVLCFVEVKTRASDWFAPPTANVDLRKQRQVTRAARVYRRMFGLEAEPYRFDVVSIVLPPDEDSNSEIGKTLINDGNERNEALFQIDLLRNFWAKDKFRHQRPQYNYWD
ncbi:MAG: YraN family protein [Pyrinomonadaceae bacterium]